MSARSRLSRLAYHLRGQPIAHFLHIGKTAGTAIGTALNPYIGYEEVAKVIKASVAEGKDLRTIVLERGLLTEAEVDRALDVEAMTKGGILK